eukprot:3686995-Ditylum_brightwellii.AAC.1
MQQKMARQMTIITDIQQQLTTSVQTIVNTDIAQMCTAAMTINLTNPPLSATHQPPQTAQMYTVTQPPALQSALQPM